MRMIKVPASFCVNCVADPVSIYREMDDKDKM